MIASLLAAGPTFVSPHLDWHAIAPELVLVGTIVLALIVDVLTPEQSKWTASSIAGLGLLAAIIPLLTLAAQLGTADIQERALRILSEQGSHGTFLRFESAEEDLAFMERHAREYPGNLVAVGSLIELYRDRQRPEADGLALLDAARAALAEDPDHLYQLAQLYSRIGQMQTAEAVLARILEVDPTHPPASNDLGYTWTERGGSLVHDDGSVKAAAAAVGPEHEAIVLDEPVRGERP